MDGFFKILGETSTLQDDEIAEKAEQSLQEFENNEEMEEDVYCRLAQTEKYLIIAAEAGNALLQKNNELQMQYDVTQEEYSKKIEELENDRIFVRKSYQEKISEYETQIHNLTLDVKFLNQNISKMESRAYLDVERLNKKLKDAIDYNETLKRESNKVQSYNCELSFEVKTLKRRIEGRAAMHNGFNDEFSYEDMMEPKMSAEQVRRLRQEKKELEETVSQFASEKILLFENIEKSKSYIASLEQKVKDYQQEISIAHSDLSAAKSSNSQLKDQLEDYIIMQASFASCQNNNNNSLMNELEKSLSQSGQNVFGNSNDEFHDEDELNFTTSSPKLKRRNTRTQNDEDTPESKNVHDQQILELNDKLNSALKDIERISKQCNTAKYQLREFEVKNLSLQQQVAQQERELTLLKKEREIILMESVSEALKQSLEDRGEACEREIKALKMLDEAKSDMLKLNSQLLEAVQQKLQLSEQLEMWQVDMATLVERQLHSKPSKTKSRTSKLFSGRWSWSSTGKLGQQQQQQQSSEEKRISS